MAVRVLAVAVIFVGILAGASLPAAAHAVLTESEPADGEVLDEAPAEVLVGFNEPVAAPVGAIRVYDSESRRVDFGDAGRAGEPSRLRVGLEENLGDGTYIVTWRATSADGHPVRGAFVFEVGEGSGADDSLVASLLASDRAVSSAAANTASRWIGYASVLVLAGGMLLRTVSGGRPDTPGARRVLVGAAWVGIAAAVGTVLFQGAEATGLGFAALADPTVIGQTLSSSVGISAMVRAGALAAFLILAGADLLTPPWAGLAAGLAAVWSFLLTGHTLTTEPMAVTIVSDGVHLAAAAAWAGGLVMLLVALRGRGPDADPVGAARLVARFSVVATVSVVALVVAGLVLAWLEVRAFRAVATPYGWTLVAKLALAAGVVGLGVYNNRRLVPSITSVAPSGPGTLGPAAATASPATRRRDWSRLTRTVTWEVTGLVAVALVTAVLVNLQPARDAAGITGAFSTYQALGDQYQVNLVVDPNRAGSNQIHVYLLSGAGRPIDPPSELTLELSKPDADIAPVVRTPRPAGPGHWIHTGPELAIPGEWVVTVRLQESEFEDLSTEISLHVNP